MKSIIAPFLIIFFFLPFVYGADVDAALDRLKEIGGVQQQYKAAVEHEDVEVRAVFLEAFTKLNAPIDGTDYEDSVHLRYYRYAMFDLVVCYHELDQSQKMLKILSWLRSTDSDIR